MRDGIFKTTKEFAMELLRYPEDTQLKFVVYEDKGNEKKLTLRCDDGVTIPYYNSAPNVVVVRLDVVEQPVYKDSFKKRYRWTFCGWDANDDEVFPCSFIKLKKFRKDNELTITQFLICMDNEGEAKAIYNQILGKIEGITSGKLCSYDGVGNLVEHWSLENMKMISTNTDPENYGSNDDDDEVIVDWGFKYEKAFKYQC